jgi:hypothetical protein
VGTGNEKHGIGVVLGWLFESSKVWPCPSEPQSREQVEAVPDPRNPFGTWR